MNEKKSIFSILAGLGVIFGFAGLLCEAGSKIPEVKDAMGGFKSGNDVPKIEQK